MNSDLKANLLQFLQVEHKIPLDTLKSVLNDCNQLPNLMPIALWQAGLVTLDQLDTILDWMELTY